MFSEHARVGLKKKNLLEEQSHGHGQDEKKESQFVFREVFLGLLGFSNECAWASVDLDMHGFSI